MAMNKNPVTAPAPTSGSPSEALDDLPLPYLEIDKNGMITRANPATIAMYPPELGDLVGKNAWDLVPIKYREMSCAEYASHMDSGEEPGVARRTLYTSSGEFRNYDTYRKLIRDAEGRPAGMRVVTVDITEAKNALDEAQQRSKWLEGLLASLQESIVVTDALGFICYLNRAAEELLGWSAAELAGKVIEQEIPILSCVSDTGDAFAFDMALQSRCKGIACILDRERRKLRVEIETSPILDAESGFTSGVVTVLRRIE